mgnify:CR=1 FL=1|jgi:hypothetical protein|nr:MAG TPA: hypothetical protein [Caudoviricetes sp.]
MKCKYYAISGEEILKRLETWDGVAYLSGYSGLTIFHQKNAQYLSKRLSEYAANRNFSPYCVHLMASGRMLMKKAKRCESIRKDRDKMHIKAVDAMRWLYESFVNETFLLSPYRREAREYVRGMADAGIVMDPFCVMEKVGEYLEEVKTFRKEAK